MEKNTVALDNMQELIKELIEEAKRLEKMPWIKVIFNDPATIILWKDGTKTVVKCQEGDIYSKRLGLLNCIAKRHFGDTGKYSDYINEVLNAVSNSDDEQILAADGIPIKVGDTLRVIHSGVKQTIIRVEDGKCYGDMPPEKQHIPLDPRCLTHIKPDTLNALRDDVTKSPRQYYADHIGHDVGLKDDEEINTAVLEHIIDRAVAIMERDA